VVIEVDSVVVSSSPDSPDPSPESSSEMVVVEVVVTEVVVAEVVVVVAEVVVVAVVVVTAVTAVNEVRTVSVVTESEIKVAPSISTAWLSTIIVATVSLIVLVMSDEETASEEVISNCCTTSQVSEEVERLRLLLLHSTNETLLTLPGLIELPQSVPATIVLYADSTDDSVADNVELEHIDESYDVAKYTVTSVS
jgi:hypothetical protein